MCLFGAAHAATPGEFEHATDVGKITQSGASEFLADKGQYRITSSGANIWGNADAFQFLWKQLSGDIVFSLEILSIETGGRKLVFRERSRFEAPNWSRDGTELLINRAGGVYTVPVGGGQPIRLNTGVADKCNNDHGLSFDGQWLAISSGGGKEGSRIYVLPATGGEPRLVTPTGPSYWHGWSPDSRQVAIVSYRHVLP
ncbi:MAG: PD40 domain-containing protein [Verrucomicrobia bacterium]|nr:PD40 domain-containing protein [Verrucomicrobiota bacterium]